MFLAFLGYSTWAWIFASANTSSGSSQGLESWSKRCFELHAVNLDIELHRVTSCKWLPENLCKTRHLAIAKASWSMAVLCLPTTARRHPSMMGTSLCTSPAHFKLGKLGNCRNCLAMAKRLGAAMPSTRNGNEHLSTHQSFQLVIQKTLKPSTRPYKLCTRHNVWPSYMVILFDHWLQWFDYVVVLCRGHKSPNLCRWRIQLKQTSKPTTTRWHKKRKTSYLGCDKPISKAEAPNQAVP